MLDPILIGYATRGGSTAEVAESMGSALEEAGLSAEVLPVRQIDSLAEWAAVILGAPLYMGRFPSEFHRFLRRHRADLERQRPWCFVLGPTQNQDKDFESARQQAEKQLARYPWLQPADLHVFGGCWNAGSLPFPFSILRRLPGNPLGKIPARDIRDWPAIRRWAAGIGRQVESIVSDGRALQ